MTRNPMPAITEKEFRQQIVDLARTLGWLAYWTWRSTHSPAGFPDLVLARERIIFAELKTQSGKLTEAQQEWITALREAGGCCYVWRPADWPSIVDVLTRKIPRVPNTEAI